MLEHEEKDSSRWRIVLSLEIYIRMGSKGSNAFQRDSALVLTLLVVALPLRERNVSWKTGEMVESSFSKVTKRV